MAPPSVRGSVEVVPVISDFTDFYGNAGVTEDTVPGSKCDAEKNVYSICGQEERRLDKKGVECFSDLLESRNAKGEGDDVLAGLNAVKARMCFLEMKQLVGELQACVSKTCDSQKNAAELEKKQYEALLDKVAYLERSLVQ